MDKKSQNSTFNFKGDEKMDINYRSVVRYEDGKEILYVEGACDSTETKPTGADVEQYADGSILVESNTGKVFFYNKKSDSWVEQFSFQG